VVETPPVTAHPTRPDERAHPGPREYVIVAAILAVITAVEVVLFYLDIPSGALVAGLLVLSLVKFTMVVLWFMHLRFDSVLFRRLFLVGILLALSVYTIVLFTFGLLVH
jgi:cytochrome c oxidase subunit IV